jgi:hypothetical protein
MLAEPSFVNSFLFFILPTQDGTESDIGIYRSLQRNSETDSMDLYL